MAAMDKKVKDLAIDIYAQSKTAKQGLGARVLTKLRSMPDNAFHFGSLAVDEDAKTDGTTIFVNSRFDPGKVLYPAAERREREEMYRKCEKETRNTIIGGSESAVREVCEPLKPPPPEMGLDQKIALISVQLCHEGVHAVQGNEILVETELHAHRQASNYYNELKTVGVACKGKKYKLHPYFRLEEKDQLIRKGELVDGLLKDARAQSELTAEWVLSHSKFWGGMAKRTPFTCEIYLRTLVRKGKLDSAQALDIVLEAMENIAPGRLNKMLTLPTRGLIAFKFQSFGNVNQRKRLAAIGSKAGIGEFSFVATTRRDAGVGAGGPPSRR